MLVTEEIGRAFKIKALISGRTSVNRLVGMSMLMVMAQILFVVKFMKLSDRVKTMFGSTELRLCGHPDGSIIEQQTRFFRLNEDLLD